MKLNQMFLFNLFLDLFTLPPILSLPQAAGTQLSVDYLISRSNENELPTVSVINSLCCFLS